MTELAVLVPVLNRPANIEPLIESFLSHCPEDAELIFLATQGDSDELDELALQGASYATSPLITWPEKINLGAANVQADWYLCAADDIRFTPGWWEATKELRNDSGVGVIGTNDSANGTGNPRVAAGDHTCHPLLRGSYIREQGTADEIGKAVHGGYSHWFVDDELIWTAKSRGAWAFCRDAVVEHLHPYWGHGEWDDTYAKGEANNEADRDLFVSRAHLFGVEVG